MFDIETPYTDLYRTKFFKRSGKPLTLHRKTCPNCDSKLVNLYYSAQAEKYMCKACLDKYLGKEQLKNGAN